MLTSGIRCLESIDDFASFGNSLWDRYLIDGFDFGLFFRTGSDTFTLLRSDMYFNSRILVIFSLSCMVSPNENLTRQLERRNIKCTDIYSRPKAA